MSIDYHIIKELTADASYVREKVFMEEQGFQEEFDEYDKDAFHLVIYYEGKPAATGRLLKKEETVSSYSIGRVAVLPEYRKLHLGNQILQQLEGKARAEGGLKIELSAQCAVQEFYQKNGYIATGEIYYDEFCPHIHMEKEL
jgi:predicted GNAT family N-acyltransferase